MNGVSRPEARAFGAGADCAPRAAFADAAASSSYDMDAISVSSDRTLAFQARTPDASSASSASSSYDMDAISVSSARTLARSASASALSASARASAAASASASTISAARASTART